MKPIIKWTGGKGDEIGEISKHIPENFTTYVEPFVGGGAIFFEVEPQRAVINDIHVDLINFYQELKAGHGPQIHALMEQSPNNEETYYRIRDQLNPQTPLDRAFQFYYLRKTCYRGMLRYNKKGGFNIPFGRYKTINYEELLNPKYAEIFGRTDITCGDFEEVFARNNSPDCFCFIDQPYDSVFTDYGYCQFERKEQERLAKCFKETKMKCLMIVGATDYIRQLYDGYVKGEYPKKYRFKLHSGRVGEDINTNHLIIKNF